jgi:hypothetical protein
MQENSVLFRIFALPLRHKLTASMIAIVIACGFFVWGRRVAERYASPALLSFDASTVRHAETGGAQPSAITLAESILGDEQVTVLTSHFDISPAPDESSLKIFRSHLKLDELGPTILRLQYLDPNGMQAVAMTNAIVEVLTAWTPVETTITPQLPVTSPPVKATYPKSVPIRSMHALLRPGDSLMRMQAQLSAIDHQLTAIEVERQKLNATKVNHSIVEKQTNTRQALETQLAAAQKKLEDLRVRYTEEYPDVGAAQEHVLDLQQQLAALPAGHGGDAAPTVNLKLEAITREASQLRLEREHLTRDIAIEKKRAREEHDVDAVQAQSSGGTGSHVPSLTTAPSTVTRASMEPLAQASVSQLTMSPFTLLQQSSYTVSGSGKPGSGLWLGMLLALVGALAYLGLAIRWYKPVHDETMLTEAVSTEVMYMGSVPRMNL